MLLGFFVSCGTALATLSKPLNPNSSRFDSWSESQKYANSRALEQQNMMRATGVNMQELQAILDNGVTNDQVREVVAGVSKVLTMATYGTSASTKAADFGSLMTKLATSFELLNHVEVEGEESYEKTRTRICFVLGLAVYKLSDITLGLTRESRDRTSVLKSAVWYFLRHLFASFYRCSEKEYPALYWNLAHYSCLFKTNLDEETGIVAKEFWRAMYVPSQQFLGLFTHAFKEKYDYVEEEERVKRFPLIDWEGFFQSVMEMSKVNSRAVDAILISVKYPIKSTNKTMMQINKDFHLYIKRIEVEMDEQFPEQQPEDLISEVIEALVPTASEDKVQEKVDRSKLDTSSNKSMKNEKKVKMTTKMAARKLKEKEKHQERLKHIQLIERDDDDVAFYYGNKNSDANLVFLRNQKEQMCRRTFEASARFEHSLFPGFTASGTTLNYLCSLMVSGNPAYDGFVAAHKDLGGIFVEKRNGNKLFLFKEPISYHKTLHAPHQSSRFDHVLYRRFYRNCGLHPYFFITS